MKLLKEFVDAAAKRFGFVRMIEVRENLDYCFSVAKRLDEHREVVEAISARTTLFEECPWHATHLASQDDYLMRLFRMVHGCWPEEAEHGYAPSDVVRLKESLPPSKLPKPIFPTVRPRPAELGRCGLPEYMADGKVPGATWEQVSCAARQAKSAEIG